MAFKYWILIDLTLMFQRNTNFHGLHRINSTAHGYVSMACKWEGFCMAEPRIRPFTEGTTSENEQVLIVLASKGDSERQIEAVVLHNSPRYH